MLRTVVLPFLLLIVGLAAIPRFLAHVRTEDAVGLLASGALVGISALRITAALRRRR